MGGVLYMERDFYLITGKGAFRSTILTIILLVIFSIVMSAADIGSQVISVYFLLVTCVSIIYGAIYSAKKNNRRGWLTGILVALLYMAILYIMKALIFGEPSIASKDLIRLSIAIAVGALSGMLGINI
jgi:putative membrane protein (TIGR04086 family)